MTTDRDQVLSEFMDAWNAGRRPSIDDYLARVAEAERDELEHDITSFIRWAETPDYDEAAIAAIRAEPEVAAAFAEYRSDAPAATWPAILAAWHESAASARDVARELVQRIPTLRKSSQPKTEQYLEHAKRGELDPARFSRKLLDALAEILRPDPSTTQSATAMAAPAMAFRAGGDAAEKVRDDLELIGDLASTPGSQDWDEVDELFRAG